MVATSPGADRVTNPTGPCWTAPSASRPSTKQGPLTDTNHMPTPRTPEQTDIKVLNLEMRALDATARGDYARANELLTLARELEAKSPARGNLPGRDDR